jgi:hypothetical protein
MIPRDTDIVGNFNHNLVLETVFLFPMLGDVLAFYSADRWQMRLDHKGWDRSGNLGHSYPEHQAVANHYFCILLIMIQHFHSGLS